MREAELLQDIVIADIPKANRKGYLCLWLLHGAKLALRRVYIEARSGVMHVLQFI